MEFHAKAVDAMVVATFADKQQSNDVQPAISNSNSNSNSNCNVSEAVIRSMVNRKVQSVIGYGSAIKVACNNGVVELSGHFDSDKDRNNALRVAIGIHCVGKVIDSTT